MTGYRTEQDLADLERYRDVYKNGIEWRTDSLKRESEELLRYVRSLMATSNPPLDEYQIKAVADAKLALREIADTIAEISAVEREYKASQVSLIAAE